MLTFTLYRNVKVTRGELATMEWAEWVEILTKHDIRPSSADDPGKHKDGAAVLFGRVKDGARRAKKNVEAVTALSADLDDVPEKAVDVFLKRLAGVEYVYHSTHKHGVPGAACPRLRFVFPLSRPVLPEEFPAVRRGFDRLTFQLSDPAARDIARLNYLPSAWNADATRSGRGRGEALDPEELAEAGRADRLPSAGTEAVKKALKRAQKVDALSVPARAVVEGRPFAWSGDRHATILALTLRVAADKRRGKGTTVDDVVEAFSASVEAMQGLDPSAPGLDDVRTAYEGALEKVGDPDDAGIQLRGREPYDEDDLARIATLAGLSTLRRNWILQKDTSYYVLDGNGAYKGPFTQAESRPAIAEELSRAPVRLWELSRNGAKKRPVADLVEEYGRVVSEVVADLIVQSTRYDEKTDIVREAARPIRIDLEPRCDPELEEFLRIFSGEQHERLLNWIACVPDCSRMLCALYISGGPGTGKTSLAHGLARLWHDGPPTEFHRLLGDFNADVANCPLILADEHVPLFWKGGSVTKLIREMIAAPQRQLARKYLPNSTLKGAIRLILASNDDFLLKSTDAMGAHDLAAVAERFLYIETPPEARAFLEALPPEKKEEWVERTIAEYSLWLYEHRTIKREKRFWVSGSISAFHRLLVASSDINAQVNQWLVYYLSNPAPIDAKNDGLVRISDGRLLVNDQAVIDGWDTYFPLSKIEPTVGKIGAALRGVSLAKGTRMRFRGKRIRYRIIDLESLFTWSDSSNIGDRETMEITLGLREDDGAEITDDLGSVRGSGKTATEKLTELRRKEDDFDDPNEVDERGDRIPF